MNDQAHAIDGAPCPHCGKAPGDAAKERFSLDWRRSSDDKRIAGVCGGLAREFEFPAALLRLGFVLATLFAGGVGLVIYAALWVIMAPDRPMGSEARLQADRPRGVAQREQSHSATTDVVARDVGTTTERSGSS